METRRLGTTDLCVSVIGLGSNALPHVRDAKGRLDRKTIAGAINAIHAGNLNPCP